MTYGTREDIAKLEQKIDRTTLINALKNAQPGAMNERSWYFWHYRLKLVKPGQKVPPVPRRNH
ncbi:MAG: hypothetical protein ACLFN5_01500 [bacterium]